LLKKQTGPRYEWIADETMSTIFLCLLQFLSNPFEHTMPLSDISGLLIAVRKEHFRVIDHRELLFNDCGDRVAQLLHVELAAPYSPSRNNDTRQEILIVNTHLLFPHDSSLSLVRLNQASTFSSLFFKKRKLIFFTGNF